MQQIPREKDIEYAQDGSATGSDRFAYLWDGSFPAEGSARASGSAPATVSDPRDTIGTSELFPHPAVVRDHNPRDSTLFRSKGEGSTGNNSTASLPHHDDIVPAQIGRETCPICIVDFEEGDDIRVLPCDGKHCFHQQCVDPWLLQLSSSCPICRHGKCIPCSYCSRQTLTNNQTFWLLKILSQVIILTLKPTNLRQSHNHPNRKDCKTVVSLAIFGLLVFASDSADQEVHAFQSDRIPLYHHYRFSLQSDRHFLRVPGSDF